MLQPVFAGVLASVVGFASTFALVLKGLEAAGATAEQAAIGLFALCMAMGFVAIALSWRTRLPITIAWSTPGAALLVTGTAPTGGFPVACGAFLTAAALIVLSGCWGAFARKVAAIPASLASAMLAGILFGLCTAPVRAVAALPALALPVILVWVVAWRWARPYAVPAAVMVAAVLIAVTTSLPPIGTGLPVITPIVPGFSLAATISIAVPLFVVTMASQNVPGLAVLASNGYRPPVGALFVWTGLASAICAAFGGHGVNLAAITAALCAGPDAHSDPARRWIAAVAGGVTYLLFGCIASVAAAFVAASPPLLIEAVAGLALLGSFSASMAAALARENERVPAIVTFVTAASGTSFLGIGSAFWGLGAGLVLLGLLRFDDR
jgi:benzoate membrane transport protein